MSTSKKPVEKRPVNPEADFETYYPGVYLRWFDVEPPVLVKITGLEEHNLFIPDANAHEWKKVILFEVVQGNTNGKTQLVLNRKSHGAGLAKATGSRKASGWIGKEVVLYKDKTRLRGKPVNCVRIRAAKTGAKANG